MQSVAAIRKVCEENGVNLIVLTAPVYTDYYKNFYDEDITNFYESLAKVTDYWDFSSSFVSSEPRFFYDSTHFRNNIGEMMATRIAEKEYPDFTPAITAIPSDFGTYVTSDTPHDYFTQRPAPRTDNDTAVKVPILTWHQLTEESAARLPFRRRRSANRFRRFPMPAATRFRLSSCAITSTTVHRCPRNPSFLHLTTAI